MLTLNSFSPLHTLEHLSCVYRIHAIVYYSLHQLYCTCFDLFTRTSLEYQLKCTQANKLTFCQILLMHCSGLLLQFLFRP